MDAFTALAQALATGLSLWQSLEKRKYLDKLMKLQREYREEFNKDPSVRSNAVLDNLEFELRQLGIAFSSAVGGQNS